MMHMEINLSECLNPEDDAEAFDSWWVTLHKGGDVVAEAWCYAGDADGLTVAMAEVQGAAGCPVQVFDYRSEMPIA